MSERGSILAGRGAAALAAALTVAAPAVAFAQQQRDRGSDAPMPGLYQASLGARQYTTPDGAVRFVLDRSGNRRAALILFEGDPEVHVLRPVMAAGGAEIYRTEDGNIELRIMPHGGVIVYTRAMRTGLPASEEGDVAPLTPDAVALAEMRERFRALQQRASRAAGQPVQFFVPSDMPAQFTGVVLDAAERAAEGLAAAPITNVNQVFLRFGPQPGVMLRDNQLIIVVAPQLGYAGRPSSIAVRNVVSGVSQGPEQ
jgi:hypothetical protein